jgi:hypothetical protein
MPYAGEMRLQARDLRGCQNFLDKELKAAVTARWSNCSCQLI